MTVYDDMRVLITGGTGSFGQKMAQRLLDHDCRHVRVLSRDEAKQHDMRIRFGDPRLEFHVGDVRDRDSVDRAMDSVDLVFHAAALKQVPSCEFFPMQAVLTNVFGSDNVIGAARSHGVSSVVCLSTDKAVLPINAMGMTKALMEKVVQSWARQEEHPTTVCSVRYGNVMYSRGSVLPLFVEQVFAGKPLTVTDPEMTRFLLSLEVAIELVEFAFAHGERGNTFIRKAPAATVGDLAAAVLMVFDAENPIDTIGVRHGEKLYETLATQEELRRAQDLGDYWKIQTDSRGLDYEQYFTEGDTDLLHHDDDYHSHNTKRLDVEATADLLLQLPEIRTALEEWSRRG